MEFRAILTILLFALLELQAKQLDPGPQAIKDSSSTSNSTQNSQKRYATKEIILYLTPSQIKALRAGQGLISSQSIPQTTEKQEENDQSLTFQEHEKFARQQFENIKGAKISQEKPNYENLELVSHVQPFQTGQSSNENQQKSVYNDFINIWRQEQPKLDDQVKSQYLYSQFGENQKIQQWGSQNEQQSDVNRWIPINSENKQEESLLDEQFKQQWNHILQQNRIQLKALSGIESQDNFDKISTQTEKPLLQMQYAPKYNDQKRAIEIEQILKDRHRQELSQEKALAKAEAIANSPPILIHQEIKVTKHHPIPVVKHVKVQVPTPVLIPVPEPYEVKVPHPYPVPLEIIKHIPVPILKTEKVEVERPVPFEVQKQVPVPVTKKVFVNVDRPYYVHRLVPVEVKKEVPVEIPIRKAEKITILRHVWND